MYNPVSTYRIQFHTDFRFSEFESILGYLQKLGVKTIYAAPVFSATPGSTHGYDGIDPNTINPEIGTLEQLEQISLELKEAGMGWLQDIVPNHMGFHTGNKWLMDVLENGPESSYAGFFDIDWNSPVYDGKLMVPFLGSQPDQAIAQSDLKLVSEGDKLWLQYYDTRYPVSKYSVTWLQQQCGATSLSACADAANHSPDLLKGFLGQQHYRLCHWQETDQQINYRRFFTINGLICLNIQEPEVFNQFHSLIGQLVKTEVFQGLRIDHVDGLYDPSAYLSDLRKLAGESCYIVVEKILQQEEHLPADWPIQGTSGYEFLAMVNNLFLNQQATEKLSRFYEKLVGPHLSVEDQIAEKKAMILFEHMGGELENLCRLFESSGLQSSPQAPRDVLRKAIARLLIAFPVYRFYGSSFPLSAEESHEQEKVLANLRKAAPELAAGIDQLEIALLVKSHKESKEFREKAAHFYRRCMQFTGPLMAKGVEDTLMYTFNRFIGNNEVGDGPEQLGHSVADFHQHMINRWKSWPLSINTTSTHDTKRGEDVRARLQVLTDLPDEWVRRVRAWRKMNKGLRSANGPDANDEYLIYQTLIGAYPMPGDPEGDFPERLTAYLVKAVREAKRHSNWSQPNEAYESAVTQFALGLLDKHSSFWTDFYAFYLRIADLGIINSLGSLLLKFTCPGVPDTYQGTELWDLSLVDPDNRRPVDYDLRLRYLNQFEVYEKEEGLLQDLWEHRSDARIKLWLTTKLMKLRTADPELFSDGIYIPLEVAGRYKRHVLAFARRHQHKWLLVLVPLGIAAICREQRCNPDQVDWRNTRINLSPEMPAEGTCLLTGKKKQLDRVLHLKDALGTIPLGLTLLEPAPNERGAGILLAVSSLPSGFGIGDLGPEARNFIAFLSKARQKYWQLLPLNPTEAGSAHSPYSSFSSMGGNPLLISPEDLVADHLLQRNDIDLYRLPATDTADYSEADRLRQLLFRKAFSNFRSGSFQGMQTAFDAFCEQEAEWLDDMALFQVIRQQHGNQPWYEWPEALKFRDADTLSGFGGQHQEELTYVKWLQFIFKKQWDNLRNYARVQGVRLFGDMPFYVSYDSVDVWAHRDIFCLDEEGRMTGIAGVPPDYFSEDGQLWGMPTFNWGVLKEQNYKWWIQRLRKNLELFDLLRIDHFRALQDYWQVPAGAQNARTGEWLPGPRKDFFKAVRKELGQLPFVAEDLGDNMDAVYQLRDEVGLPGMKVLQFAWGEHMPKSVDIPHNFQHNTIVYTGTHDNNTTIGWYREETNRQDHERMHHYLGLKVRRRNIHEVLARVAWASVAQTAILPMQDLLGLDATTRMNTPGTTKNNWKWRLQPGQADDRLAAMLRDWTDTFDRY